MAQTMWSMRSSKAVSVSRPARRTALNNRRVSAARLENLFGVFQQTPQAPVAPAVPRAPVRVEAAAFSPPPVADTKRKFLEGYRKPIPSIYNTVVQELLVAQHFVRYNSNYQYDEVLALGFVSVFDQILDGIEESEKAGIFTAYIKALAEDPEKYKRDAANLEQWASALDGADGLTPDANGSDVQKVLARIASRVQEDKFQYSKFFAIGLFRLLELTGAKEPAALEKLVTSVNVKPTAVNKDLMFYKGVLSKLTAAKELMRDFLEREQKKQAEREAAKAAKAEGDVAVSESQPTVQA